MKDYKTHKFKFNPYLEKLYQSDKPIVIYKVNNGYNIYTDFSEKFILTEKNIDKFFKKISNKNIKKKQIYISDFLDINCFAIYWN